MTRSTSYELELGPFFLPKVSTTLTNLLLYWILLLARPVFFFFFSPASTLGVCPRTFPARAREPWTFPPLRGTVTSRVASAREASSTLASMGLPEQKRLSSAVRSSSEIWKCAENYYLFNVQIQLFQFVHSCFRIPIHIFLNFELRKHLGISHRPI